MSGIAAVGWEDEFIKNLANELGYVPTKSELRHYFALRMKYLSGKVDEAGMIIGRVMDSIFYSYEAHS